MDMMSYFRLKNIMGGGDESDDDNSDDQSSDDQFSGPINQPSNHVDAAARMAQLYQPHNTANDAFVSASSQLPNREDYQRGTGGKILAAIAGMGAGAGPVGIAGGSPVGFRGNPGAAFTTSQGIMNAPYDRAVDDYNTKLKPLATAATLEDRDNTNNRLAANETVSREIASERAGIADKESDRRFRLDTSTIAHREANEKLAQDRNYLREKLADKPSLKTFTGQDGYIYAIDTKDPTGKVIKTAIKSNQLSDFEKFQMRHDNALSEIEARRKAGETLEQARQRNRLELKQTPGATKDNAGEDDVTTTQEVVDPANQTKTTTTTKAKNPRGVQKGDVTLPKSTLGSFTGPVDNNPKPIPQANKDAAIQLQRQKAIDLLKSKNKEVNETSINFILNQWNKK